MRDRSLDSKDLQEQVGAGFSSDKVRRARDLTLEVIERLRALIHPGMIESEAKTLLKSIVAELGCEAMWHAPQIRFGANTRLPFGKPGVIDVPLQSNDLYFLDFGLVAEGHEGDVGRTYAIGNDPDMIRIAQDAQDIWWEIRNAWHAQALSGVETYKRAREAAALRGWVLNLEEANGHRIGDFPHVRQYEGSVEGCVHALGEDRWILEVQLLHPTRPFGAFYEDLLA